MVSRKRSGRVIFVLALVSFAAGAFLMSARRTAGPLAEADLQDGRILQVEGVSFGTKHQVGNDLGVLEKFRAWWPGRFWDAIAPKFPKTRIEKDDPVLVIWLTAVDSTSRTNVDCQGVRVELLDAAGVKFGEDQPHWFGYDKGFSRVGHMFRVFPRHEKELRVKVAKWSGTNSVEFILKNPGFTNPKDWKGEKAPSTRQVGEYEVRLRAIRKATNSAVSWKGERVYWKPELELRRKGNKLDGWDLEWTAEDAWGNRGHELGIREQVLKINATFYPQGTNRSNAILVTNTPAAILGSNVWWNLDATVRSEGEANRVTILGLFEPGVHTFSEGEYLTNPPTRFAPVRGGSPTGWVGSSRRTPLKVENYDGHYTDVPVIYVRVADVKSKQRIAVRVRDVESGNYFSAKPEDQGVRSGIVPFLVKLPEKGHRVEVELVLLPPVNAEFLVETGGD